MSTLITIYLTGYVITVVYDINYENNDIFNAMRYNIWWPFNFFFEILDAILNIFENR